MKFAYGSNAYTQHTLQEAIASVAALGYRGIELLADEPHLPGRTMRNHEIQEIRVALDRHDLEISNVNCNTSVLYGTESTDPEFGPTILEQDETLRETRISHIHRTIENAYQLGAPCLCISSGRVPENMSEQTAEELVEDALHRVLDKAHERDLPIGIEFEPGHFFGSTRETLDWIDRMDDPLLGLNFDVGHAWVVHEDPAELIRNHADRMWNIHLEDIPGRTHEHIIPGEGDLPLDDVIAALLDVNFERFCTVELYPYTDKPNDAGQRALEYLNELTSNSSEHDR
jgi:sugar phosphate isomerase/epimerase